MSREHFTESGSDDSNFGLGDDTAVDMRETRFAGATCAVSQRASGDGAPHTIGRFTVIKRLGAGGMGVVYSAFDDELERKVAIKLVRPEATESRDALRARLLREAKSLARLSHPNVVAVHEVGTHEDQVFLVMEFIRGITLRSWLGERKRSSAEIVAMFLDVGRGLAAAHELGLVHRDFKPSNVLIDASGRPRVIDFGLAQVAASLRSNGGSHGDDGVRDHGNEGGRDGASRGCSGEPPTRPIAQSAYSRSLTQTGVVLGTPNYMSPEQFSGKPLDVSSDQFSYCVALYQALYGRDPFGGNSIPERMHAVLTGALVPPPVKPPVPPAISAALERGLAVQPEKRWPTMDDLLAALGSILSDHEPSRHDPGVRQFLRRYILLNALIIASITGLLVYLDHTYQQVRVITPAGSVISHVVGGSILLLGIWLTRSQWRRALFHRRLAALFAVIVGCSVLNQPIAYLVGSTTTQMVVQQMVITTALLTLASLHIARWLWWTVVIHSAGVAVTVISPGDHFVAVYALVDVGSLAVAAVVLRPRR
ncbi:MAG: serine/threonine protein kinase [Proteobacteria bacterium]|nr:serine/threonine protein kinase [Pseudomonadota bacterium]